MSITVTNPTTKVGFIANGVSSDARGCETLKAGVSGKRIKVRQLILSNNSAGTVAFTIGEGVSGGAPETALLGPISLLTGQNLPMTFNPEMELTAGKDLTVDVDAAGAICVMAQGNIE